ncbi:MAG: DUF1564 domain-containing protein [Leptospira sp.]|nr:DUF1564 domain-containing protein [Leptospira sp.]
MIETTFQERTQSTLLVPDRFKEDYLLKTGVIGREMYFHFLLRRYAPLIRAGVFGERKKTKISYQAKDNELIRKNFRPINSDWIEFGLLADYLGLSKTALFAMLLMFDISDWPVFLRERWYEGGVPPTVANVASSIHLKYVIPVCVSRKIRYKTRK